jgi:hypothetical protein
MPSPHRTFRLHLLLALALLVAPDSALAEPPVEPASWAVGLETSESYLGRTAGGQRRVGGFSVGLRAGRRWSWWGMYGVTELVSWENRYADGDMQELVVDLGAGVEGLFIDRRVRASLSLGASILARDNPIDHAGRVGPYFDLRPGGYRLRLRGGLYLLIEPLTLHLIVPVLEGIPLAVVQYRTVLTLEVAR